MSVQLGQARPVLTTMLEGTEALREPFHGKTGTKKRVDSSLESTNAGMGAEDGDLGRVKRKLLTSCEV